MICSRCSNASFGKKISSLSQKAGWEMSNSELIIRRIALLKMLEKWLASSVTRGSTGVFLSYFLIRPKMAYCCHIWTENAHCVVGSFYHSWHLLPRFTFERVRLVPKMVYCCHIWTRAAHCVVGSFYHSWLLLPRFTFTRVRSATKMAYCCHIWIRAAHCVVESFYRCWFILPSFTITRERL